MWKYNALAIVNEQAMEGIQKSTLVNPISVSGPPPVRLCHTRTIILMTFCF